MQASDPYTFPRLTRADYPLLRGWLAQPHVRAWWGDPEEEIALIEEDIDGGPTDMRLVVQNDQPFAYVQDYEVHAYDMPQFADLPQGARGMDSFLGDPAYLGQGHGSGFIAARAAQLLGAGAPLVAVDPDPANRRAIAAYTRAGFRPGDLRPSEDGDPCQVMILP